MIPSARQRVRVEGRDELFLVVWVDHEHQAAELIPLLHGDCLETVPFSRIRPSDGSAMGASHPHPEDAAPGLGLLSE